MLRKPRFNRAWTRVIMRTVACDLVAASLTVTALAQDVDLATDVKEPSRQISGLITDAESGLPISGVQVFYSGTTIGDVSNDEGFYILPTPPVETIEIVLSMLGYEYVTQHVDLLTFEFRSLDFKMTARVIDLEGITITDDRDKSWYKNLERFKKVFFGNTSFATSCRLINPKVMSFFSDENEERLSVTAMLPLVFENQALGYRVTFHDLSLEKQRLKYQWRADPQFELLTPEDSGQKRKWGKNRRQAYNGSLRHFLNSLIRDELNEDGFAVYDVNAPGEYNLHRPIPEMIRLNSESSPPIMPVLVRNDSLGTYLFQFPATLLIIYLKERESAAYSATQPRSLARPPFDDDQTTWIELNVPMVPINTNGNLIFRGAGYPIRTSGYLSWERVCELLPFDYDPLIDD